MRRNFLRLAAAAAATASLAACGGDDEAPTSRLRAVHASADAPAVDVLRGTQVIAAGAQFKQASGYAVTPSGASTLNVNLAGTSTVALSAALDLSGNRAYSAIVVGSAAAGAPQAQALSTVLVNDDGAAPSSGNLKLRVVHGAPAVPAVDIYVMPPGAPLATPAIAALAYKGVAPASAAPGPADPRRGLSDSRHGRGPAGDHRVRLRSSHAPRRQRPADRRRAERWRPLADFAAGGAGDRRRVRGL